MPSRKDCLFVRLKETCHSIGRKKFIELGSRRPRFYRTGDYFHHVEHVKFSESDFRLYRWGRCRICALIPAHAYRSPWKSSRASAAHMGYLIVRDPLAYKKSWNTADLAGGDPITSALLRRVG
jgi:hypothetical protein